MNDGEDMESNRTKKTQRELRLAEEREAEIIALRGQLEEARHICVDMEFDLRRVQLSNLELMAYVRELAAQVCDNEGSEAGAKLAIAIRSIVVDTETGL